VASYYDDNFGHWDIDDEDDVEFYREIQETNVEKKCEGCGRMVRIQPQYAYCNSCADKRERGEEIYAEDE
jgi:Zn finger protein HypA/HybF involved in hydrogenase expression